MEFNYGLGLSMKHNQTEKNMETEMDTGLTVAYGQQGNQKLGLPSSFKVPKRSATESTYCRLQCIEIPDSLYEEC